MAAAGTTNLSIAKKAKIIAEKQALSVSVSEIANRNGVSRRTVHRVFLEKDPEVLHLAGRYIETILEKSKRNVAVGLDVMYERMLSPEAKLGEIVTAVRTSHEIVQLNSGGPTQNMSEASMSIATKLFLERFGSEAGSMMLEAKFLRKYHSEEEIMKGVQMLEAGEIR